MTVPEPTGASAEHWATFRSMVVVALSIAILLVVTVLVAGTVGGMGRLTPVPIIVGAFYAFNAAAWAVARRRPAWIAPPYYFNHFVLGTYMLFVTVILYYCLGGPHRIHGMPMYALAVAYAVVFLSSRGAWVLAILGSVSYATLVAALCGGWLPEQPGMLAFSFMEGWPAMTVVANTLLLGLLAFLGGLLTDVRRRQTEQLQTLSRQLRATNESLEGLNRELELYTRAVSHDVRSPVAAAAEALWLAQQAPAEERGRLTSLAAENVGRADRMLVGLRDLMRSAGAPEAVDRVAPRALIEQVVAEVRGARDAPDLPITLVGAFGDLRAQPTKLAHAFRNLLDNAVMHARGRPGARIEVGGEAGAGEVRFWVRDNGPGIPYTHQAAIFEPFRRGPGANGEGMGLGLALVRQIVEQHGGRIWVESVPGEGATFWVALPREPAS